MSRGSRKKRRKFCLPSCFSAPSVRDLEESELAQDGLQIAFLSRLRSRSRTVPVMEIAGDGGEEYLEVRSTPGNQGKGLGQIFRRKEKNAKTAPPNSTHAPRSSRAHIQQSFSCHVSTKCKSRSLPITPPHHARVPVQSASRTSKPVPPQANRPPVPASPPARSSPRFDAVAALLVVAATLAVLLFFGRLCAVLCNCAWFYLLSRVPPPAAAKDAWSPLPETAEEVDLDSPEYKKKVVLMGLLERNRYGVSGTPEASPARARYINC